MLCRFWRDLRGYGCPFWLALVLTGVVAWSVFLLWLLSLDGDK